ncbi:transposase [Candidatus Bipolaricaulota bacterium]|nr:transposase [Candidatus Bipolaricaulota bacterium]
MEDKVALAEKSREEYGLNMCLRALGLSKGAWHRRQRRPAAPEKDRELKAEVLAVVGDHPVYGSRRIGAELRSRGVPVNHKRLRRVLGMRDLALPRKVARPRPRCEDPPDGEREPRSRWGKGDGAPPGSVDGLHGDPVRRGDEESAPDGGGGRGERVGAGMGGGVERRGGQRPGAMGHRLGRPGGIHPGDAQLRGEPRLDRTASRASPGVGRRVSVGCRRLIGGKHGLPPVRLFAGRTWGGYSRSGRWTTRSMS